MRSSELVTPQHLARKAVIYVRQSTPNQVLTNSESLSLQYALKKRAGELGWRADDVEVIDSDLGCTASEAANREGFKSPSDGSGSSSPRRSPASRATARTGTRYWTSAATRDA